MKVLSAGLDEFAKAIETEGRNPYNQGGEFPYMIEGFVSAAKQFAEDASRLEKEAGALKERILQTNFWLGPGPRPDHVLLEAYNFLALLAGEEKIGMEVLRQRLNLGTATI